MSKNKQQQFLKLYRDCHDPFVKYCSALAYGKIEVEDLIQDVLFSAYKHFDNIDAPEKLLHYLIRAAKNRSISHWRKHKNKTELIDKHEHNLISKEISIEKILDIQYLYTQLNLLPDKQRDALILFEISGFSMKEIAIIQNSTEGAIKTKISRGRKRLKVLLNTESLNYKTQ